MNNIPEGTPPKRVRPHYKALYEESQTIFAMINDLELTDWQDQRRAQVSNIAELYQLVMDLEEEKEANSGIQDHFKLTEQQLKEQVAELEAEVEEKRAERKADTCFLIEANQKLKEQVEELEVEVDKLNEECDHRAPGDDYDALEISCDILREENECNKKNFLETLDENKKLKAEIEKLREESLQTKFDAWREVQQETNPQYTIDEEIGCLLCESDDTKLIKKIFDELYAGQYEYVIETETYRACEDEDDE